MICTAPAVALPGRIIVAVIEWPPWFTVETSTRGPDWNCEGATVSDEVGFRLIPKVAWAINWASGMMSPVVWTPPRLPRLAPKSRLKPPASPIGSAGDVDVNPVSGTMNAVVSPSTSTTEWAVMWLDSPSRLSNALSTSAAFAPSGILLLTWREPPFL